MGGHFVKLGPKRHAGSFHGDPGGNMNDFQDPAERVAGYQDGGRSGNRVSLPDVPLYIDGPDIDLFTLVNRLLKGI